MLQPNPHLAPARRRKESLLPQIARLSLADETARKTAAKVGVSKTSVIRWRKSLRRDCATRAVAETMQMVDELIDGCKTVYGKALEGWDRSQADKEIRTVVDSGLDDSKKIGCSHTSDLATSMNRDVRRIMTSPAYEELFPETLVKKPGARSMARMEARCTLNLFGHDFGPHRAGPARSQDGAVLRREEARYGGHRGGNLECGYLSPLWFAAERL